MATYIKTLKDENGDIVLPRTRKSAIQDVINEVPSGGAAGQVLTKNTDGYSWQNAQVGPVTSVNTRTGAVTVNEVPSGGTTNQVLTKTASGYAWANSGGGFVISSSQPSDTSLLWIDSTNNLLKYYINGVWKAVSGVWQ